MGPVSGFFFLHLRDEPEAPVAYGIDDPERDELLVEPGRVEGWVPLEVEVRGGAPTDYLANNVGVRLCSERLKEALEQASTGADEFQWLDAEVLDEAGTRHKYYVLHFPALPEVLDPERTITSRGWFVVKPVVARSRVGQHCVFSFPGGTSRTVITDQVRKAIEQAGCTGVDFAPVAVV